MSATGDRGGSGERARGKERDGERAGADEAERAGAPGAGGPGATLVLPAELRALAGGTAAVRLSGRPATVGEALEELRAAHPAAYARLVTEQGALRPHVNVFLDGEDVRRADGLATPLADAAEILVLRSVSGG